MLVANKSSYVFFCCIHVKLGKFPIFKGEKQADGYRSLVLEDDVEDMDVG